MDGDDLRRAVIAMGDAGETDAEGNSGEPLAIYHSHVRSPARPSPTDVADAARWPYSYYIVVSLTEKPDIGAYRITAGVVREVELVTTD